MATLRDYYNTGDDAGFDAAGPGPDVYALGQTFTASEAYSLTSVKLKLLRSDEYAPGTVTVEIYATSGGLPTGDALASGTTDGDTLTTSAAGEWREITLDSAYTVASGTTYAIVCYATETEQNALRWRTDATSPTYSGGNNVIEINSVWSAYTQYDCVFECWGEDLPVNEIVRVIDFIYSSEIAYVVELGAEYMRFYYDDELITSISTDYAEEHLFELQYEQIADTMWITHSSYPPSKLTRTSATTFSLDEIEFKKGPFMLRNDLIDVDVTDTAYMLYEPGSGQGADVGDTGTLTCQDSEEGAISFFESTHVGALFKLTTQRWNKVSKGKLTGRQTGVLCPPIDVKGQFRWTTHGRWNAVVELQKNENDTGWTNVESYEGAKDINVPTAVKTEDGDNVQYRVNVSDEEGKRVSSTIKSSITVLNDIVESIFKVTAINSESEAAVEVIAKMESVTISGITKANPGVVTASYHGLKKGDEILISNVAGMTEVNGVQTVLKVLTKDTFRLDLDTSGYTTYTSGGVITPPPTRRWAEGAWSAKRGYPTSVTFMDNRCVYGGMAEIPEQVVPA